VGVYNVLEAARQAGVRRVVAASNGAVVAGYEKDEPYASLSKGVRPDGSVEMISPTSKIRPTSIYTATKLGGEALAAYFVEAHGMSIISVRVGKVEVADVPASVRAEAVWCSHRDIVQFLEKCVDAPDEIGFEILFAVSDNATGYREWQSAKELVGYEPQDNSAMHGF